MTNYAALATEINTDPTALGYAAHVATGDDAAVAGLLNEVRETITVRRSDIAVADVYAAINVADYTALGGNPTAAALSTERRYLAWLTGLAAMASVRLLNDDGSDAPAVTNFKAMFPAGSATFVRLAALASRTGSRAEQLFGANTRVTTTDVAIALGRV